MKKAVPQQTVAAPVPVQVPRSVSTTLIPLVTSIVLSVVGGRAGGWVGVCVLGAGVGRAGLEARSADPQAALAPTPRAPGLYVSEWVMSRMTMGPQSYHQSLGLVVSWRNL